VSPVFEHDKEGVVVRLLRAALTNNPNLYLKAIAARVECSGQEEVTRADESSGNEMGWDELIAALRSVLGCEADAEPAAIVAAVRKLVEGRQAASATSDRGRYVSLDHYQSAVRELTELQATRVREAAERSVEEAMRAGRLVPAQREWAIEYCRADAVGFAQFIARQPALALGALALDGEPRRAQGRRSAEPSALGVEGLSTLETAICARLGLREADYVRRKAARDRDAGSL
jgi:phage I-like protein